VGLLCVAMTVAPLAPLGAQEAEIFRVLKLDGHQVRWRLPADGAPRIITYRLVTEPTRLPGARNCRSLTGLDGLAARSGMSLTLIRDEVAAAFAMWEAAANVIFKEAAEGAQADILIGAQAEPEGWAFADVFYDTSSPEAIKPISQALVCLNPTRQWKVGFDGDLKSYDLRYTLAHEIGHAIGLDHPAGGNQIMGYRYEERFRALQPGDIRGAVLLYGPPGPATVRVAAEPPRGPAHAASK
jgi:Matrixin